MNAASEVLTNAANYIEKHGWCQGNYRGPNGAVCAMGAIDAVTKNRRSYVSPYLEAQNQLLFYLNVGRDFTWNSVPQWNDSHSRTKEQVVQAMREAAAR